MAGAGSGKREKKGTTAGKPSAITLYHKDSTTHGTAVQVKGIWVVPVYSPL